MADEPRLPGDARRRVLIYVPIVHTAADLGSQAEPVRAHFAARFGQAALRRRDAAIGRMWTAIREQVLSLDLDWRRVNVYQDGLPVCGREREIVAEVAAKGSENHVLIRELGEKGARLMGTEDPSLLVREYQRVTRLMRLGADRPEARAVAEEAKAEGERLLAERDAFIARRIAGTLGPGEVGLAFMGLLHQVHERLAKEAGDIEVRLLMRALPLGAG